MTKRKGINRKRTRAEIILIIGFVICLFLGRISRNSCLMVVSCLFLILWLILFLMTNRCPYCGAYFLGLFWFEKSAGYCQKCGKLMEFDDSAE